MLDLISRDKWVAVIKSNIELSIRSHAESPPSPNQSSYLNQQSIEDGTSTVLEYQSTTSPTNGYYEMHSSASSLAGLEIQSGRPSMAHNDSLNSLRRAILDINAYSKMLYKQMDQLESHFEDIDGKHEGVLNADGDSSAADSIRCDILT